MVVDMASSGGAFAMVVDANTGTLAMVKVVDVAFEIVVDADTGASAKVVVAGMAFVEVEAA